MQEAASATPYGSREIKISALGKSLLLHFTFICSPHLDIKSASNTPAPEENVLVVFFPPFFKETCFYRHIPVQQ